MSEKRLQYINRTYDEYRNSIINITKKYYPDVFGNLNDASIGNWLIDVLSDCGDNLNFHIDRTYQETSIDSASQLSTVQNIARTNGLKIPGKKAALCEVEISCNLPLYTQGVSGDGDIKRADESYCPYIRKGTLFSTGSITFELMADVNFREQFDENGYSNRQILPIKDSNNNIIGYKYKKLAVVSAGQSKIYKKVLTSSDIKPFMEITLQDSDILGVESIIVKQGTNLGADPLISDFSVDEEKYYDRNNSPVERYFEVDNLIDQFRFGYEVDMTEDGKPISSDEHMEGYRKGNLETNNYYNPIWSEDEVIEIDGENFAIKQVVKGKWKRLKNKFITEYTDNWNLKITFGSGIRNKYGDIPDDAKEFTKYMMSRMQANDYMGVLPEENSTIYILYRVGGGEMSNIAKDTLTNIIYLNMQIDGNCNDDQDSRKKLNVKNSLTVTNTTPSYGGKDEPNESEIKYMIKYNSCSQNRCVTINDYYATLNRMPAKYGLPFRMGVIEENNKIVIYTLGLDYMGKLTNLLAETVADNMKEYLKMYKNANDFIEIKSGKIINLAFRFSVFIDKTYDKAEVSKRIIETVYDYMDIRRHQMGEDIFLGDVEKEISKLDGVLNLISMKVYNKVGDGYSSDAISQQLVSVSDCCYDDYIESGVNIDNQIDLNSSDYMLIGDVGSMFEVKNINDIVVSVKTR